MRLVGYADRLSVEQGGAIDFMVSSELPTYRADVVRMFHGDPHPDGPGLKCTEVASDIAGEHQGVFQEVRTGSYVRINHDERLNLDGSFTIQLWVWPTTPDKDKQALLSKGQAGHEGYAVRLLDGRVSLQVGSTVVTLSNPLGARRWYSVAATYDAPTQKLRLSVTALASTDSEADETAECSVALAGAGAKDDVLVAAQVAGEAGEVLAADIYNGKIDAPRIFDRALDGDELAALRAGEAVAGDALVAAWDFSADISSSAVTDASGNDHHGHAVNKPTRAATGWNWDGSETAWVHARDQYGAIHFHDDDLDDAGWSPSLSWTVPEELPSGVYAVRLRGDSEELDYVPFIVRPRRGHPTARIALLIPTFSYLAYANEHMLEFGAEAMEAFGATGAAAKDYPSQPQDKYIVEHRLNSLYDAHSDGSGVCYSSRLRPLLNMRPNYKMSHMNDGEGSAHQFNADLHLVDWLEDAGYTVDVLTDEDLHLEGLGLLEPYDVVLTGSHHEYWSGQMIDATQQYLRGGGRLMYLAANGMYWVTQHDPENANGIEIRRRGPSTRAWEPEPGEAHLSATGELGGLWRYRGRPPQSWVGVGFTAQGLGEGRPYERQPASFDDAASWVFDGIGDDELIGDFPCLINGYGAAGFEIDRADHRLGTPYRTLVLATASGFSDSYQHASEEIFMSNSLQGGSVNPFVKADMVLLEYPEGGAVFSPGSISWCGCLSHNGYENNVARITKNVLDRFSSTDEAKFGSPSSRGSALNEEEAV